MNMMFHLLKRDFQGARYLFWSWWSYLAVAGLALWLYGNRTPGNVVDALGQWASLATVLSLFLLGAWLAHLDTPAGEGTFTLTRPVRPLVLLTSKALLLGIGAVLPAMAVHVFVLFGQGMPLDELAGVCLETGLRATWPVVFGFLLSSLVTGPRGLVLGVVGAYVALAALLWLVEFLREALDWEFLALNIPLDGFGSVPSGLWWVALAGILILFQYLRRQRFRVAVLSAAALVVASLALGVSGNISPLPWGQVVPGKAVPASFTFDPVGESFSYSGFGKDDAPSFAAYGILRLEAGTAGQRLVGRDLRAHLELPGGEILRFDSKWDRSGGQSLAAALAGNPPEPPILGRERLIQLLDPSKEEFYALADIPGTLEVTALVSVVEGRVLKDLPLLPEAAAEVGKWQVEVTGFRPDPPVKRRQPGGAFEEYRSQMHLGLEYRGTPGAGSSPPFSILTPMEIFAASEEYREAVKARSTGSGSGSGGATSYRKLPGLLSKPRFTILEVEDESSIYGPLPWIPHPDPQRNRVYLVEGKTVQRLVCRLKVENVSLRELTFRATLKRSKEKGSPPFHQVESSCHQVLG